MIQLSGKIDGGFPFQAVTNGSACSVGVSGIRITGSVSGFAWVLEIDNRANASAFQVDATCFFKWPNVSREWWAEWRQGPEPTVVAGPSGFHAQWIGTAPAGESIQIAGSFGLKGDMNDDGKVDASDLALALAKGMSGVEMAKLLGNWG